jgi:uncharacterized protein (DUF362 family)
MRGTQHNLSRRDFLKAAACGLASGFVVVSFPRVARPAAPPVNSIRAALTQGDSRADNIFKALKMIEGDIKKSLSRKKRVVIKPNFVAVDRQLCATHVDGVEATLEFLKPLVKEEIIIAESPGGAPASEGFENYGYHRLEKKYNVRLVDLDEQPYTILHAIDDKYYPQPFRCATLLLDPDVFVISSAVMKTHDRAVVTLSLKNIVVGAAIKDKGFRWGRRGTERNDKPIIHGGRADAGIHYNLFMLSEKLHPDLSIIDGFLGMEGNGPMGGDPVDHKVAIASTDWVAADRIAVELMGFDFAKVGYLWFAIQAGIGQGDLSKIEILGERVQDHIRKYRPHDRIEQQYKWKEGPQLTWPARSA